MDMKLVSYLLAMIIRSDGGNYRRHRALADVVCGRNCSMFSFRLLFLPRRWNVTLLHSVTFIFTTGVFIVCTAFNKTKQNKTRIDISATLLKYMCFMLR